MTHYEKKRRNKKVGGDSPSIRVFFYLFLVVGGLYIIAAATGYLIRPAEKVSSVPERLGDPNRIKVQVFNGCKRARVVLEIKDVLRRIGEIDVVSIETDASYLYPKTIVLDRKGNPSLMKKLRELIGLPGDRVILQRNEQIEDATIVVGEDAMDILGKLKKLYPAG